MSSSSFLSMKNWFNLIKSIKCGVFHLFHAKDLTQSTLPFKPLHHLRIHFRQVHNELLLSCRHQMSIHLLLNPVCGILFKQYYHFPNFHLQAPSTSIPAFQLPTFLHISTSLSANRIKTSATDTIASHGSATHNSLVITSITITDNKGLNTDPWLVSSSH